MEEKKFDQSRYIADWKKENYSRIVIDCRKEVKEQLKEKAKAAGMSLSEYLITKAIEA